MSTSTVENGALTFDTFDGWSAGDTVAFASACFCVTDSDDASEPSAGQDDDV